MVAVAVVAVVEPSAHERSEQGSQCEGGDGPHRRARLGDPIGPPRIAMREAGEEIVAFGGEDELESLDGDN